MNSKDTLSKWHCKDCNRVLVVSGIFIQNDKLGTSTIMYDCPVCGKDDICNRLGQIMTIEEKLPKETFINKILHMTKLVIKTNKILSKLKCKPSLKLC